MTVDPARVVACAREAGLVVSDTEDGPELSVPHVDTLTQPTLLLDSPQSGRWWLVDDIYGQAELGCDADPFAAVAQAREHIQAVHAAQMTALDRLEAVLRAATEPMEQAA